MKRLFLTSDFSITGSLLKNVWNISPPVQIGVLTAQSKNIEKLKEIGFDVIEINIDETAGFLLYEKLQKFNAIYTEFNAGIDEDTIKIIKQLVEKEDKLFIGDLHNNIFETINFGQISNNQAVWIEGENIKILGE